VRRGELPDGDGSASARGFDRTLIAFLRGIVAAENGAAIIITVRATYTGNDPDEYAGVMEDMRLDVEAAAQVYESHEVSVGSAEATG
jgi:hypothetical protein